MIVGREDFMLDQEANRARAEGYRQGLADARAIVAGHGNPSGSWAVECFTAYLLRELEQMGKEGGPS